MAASLRLVLNDIVELSPTPVAELTLDRVPPDARTTASSLECSAETVFRTCSSNGRPATG